MLQVEVKHMPTAKEFKDTKTVELCTGKIVSGWQIYCRASNYGMQDLREELKLMSKKEYIRSVEKSVHNRRPVL
jgi:hypothetical protein